MTIRMSFALSYGYIGVFQKLYNHLQYEERKKSIRCHFSLVYLIKFHDRFVSPGGKIDGTHLLSDYHRGFDNMQ